MLKYSGKDVYGLNFSFLSGDPFKILPLFCSLQLKKELGSFDPAFFDELEDLKYNYQKSLTKNSLLEKQLVDLSEQLGIEVNIPP